MLEKNNGGGLYKELWVCGKKLLETLLQSLIGHEPGIRHTRGDSAAPPEL